ncbi:putative TLC domain-containing protein C17A2.02c [Hypsizygus marmoreus]|uniref:TLC domain-containing protein C17A2.02c n=1 Tax=Hypsizygus marmoreus TaxID=39966 RepID=A0A369JL45_HYPMA|nr:putative TLC domain-containing protein C17A2.02c [Hypsizygus marmoreus]
MTSQTPSPALDRFIKDTLGLTKLPAHLPIFTLSFLGFLFVHQIAAPWASRRWFPVAYGGGTKRARNAWSIHVVSQIHALLIVPLALYVRAHESAARREDRAFGWDGRVGMLHAIACGYFLWDTLDAIVNFTDLGFVAHGIACLAIYVMSYKPFVAYYGTRCLLWESSTFFLNIHWFLDKTGRTGSRAQFINGILLLSAFFSVRLVYGGKVSYEFMKTLAQVRNEIPFSYVVTYMAGNVVLQGLNWFWFYKMISSLRRRFRGPGERDKLINGGARAEGDTEHGNGNGSGAEGGIATGVATGYGTHAN